MNDVNPASPTGPNSGNGPATPDSPASSAAPLLRVKNLRVRFRTDKVNTFEAVKGISFDVPKNSTVALVGESGSGKSVSSLAVMGLLPEQTTLIDPASEVEFNGQNLFALSKKQRRELCGKDISMIFQEPMSSLNPVFTVGFQLCEVLRLHMGMDARAARERALALLEEVGIPDPKTKINAFPSQMSGGQQQRVMIAMAIACEPKLLIADEPTTALDVTIQKQIMDLIGALQKKHHMSVLFITHDLGLVGEIADSVIVMRHGEIREMGPVEPIFKRPQDSYTQALLHCRPPLDSRPLRLPVIDDYIAGKVGAGKVGTGMGGAGEGGGLGGSLAGSLSNEPQRSRGVLPGDENVLVVKNLSKSFFTREGWFGKKEFHAVRDVSFNLPRGKTIGVVGESGSGKTTVGLTLLRLHKATGGTALFEGRDLISMSDREYQAYKRRIQIIFQNPYASLNPRFTVGQILMEPMRIHNIGGNDAGRVDLSYQLLKKVGLPEVAFHRYPHEFSGGQRQRIAIARCLTMRPEILVCDESVSALDVSVQAQVLNLLQDLQDEFKMSYIFISHDLSVVKYMADQVMVMNQGQVVEIADSDDLYRNPQQAYTRALLSAIPKGLHG
jgi:peptide/nickel transport system ATP-binding protein